MEFFQNIGKEIEGLSDEAVNGKERRLAKWREEKAAEAAAKAAEEKQPDFNSGGTK